MSTLFTLISVMSGMVLFAGVLVMMEHYFPRNETPEEMSPEDYR